MKPRVNYDFASKWSPEIAKWGHTPMPNLIITHQGQLSITNGELAVLLGLINYMWTNDHPYPSVSTLAQHSGMASKTIRGHIRKLETKGYIRRKFRTATTNEYDIGPLKAKLHEIAKTTGSPAQKRTPLYSHLDSYHYPKSDTKKDEANKTKRRRPFVNYKTTQIGDIFRERYGVSDEK